MKRNQFPIFGTGSTLLKLISIDWETYLFSAGNRAPRGVCLSTYDGTNTGLYNRADALRILEKYLLDDSILLSGQNIAFDMVVTAANAPHLTNAIFRAYDLGRIKCTKISEQLIDIADGSYTTKEKGRYTLDGMLRRHHGIDISETKGKKHKYFNPSEDLGKEFFHLLNRFYRINNYMKGLITIDEALLTKEFRPSKGHIGKTVEDFEQWHFSLLDERDALHKNILAIVGDWEEIPWRLRFAEMEGVPVSQYPEAARKYSVMDTEYDYLLSLGQGERAGRISYPVSSEVPSLIDYRDGPYHVIDGKRQCANDFSLYLTTCWGFRTDHNSIEEIKEPLVQGLEKLNEKLENVGFLKMNRTGPRKGQYSRDMKVIKAQVEKAYRGNPPRNDVTVDEEGNAKAEVGSIKTDKVTLEESGDPLLEDLAERTSYEDIFVKWIPTLESGILIPVHTNYKCLVETGRTSSFDFNSQNQPRKGGIRDCFIPHDGYVFCSSDYGSIELRTLAQVCLWMFSEPDENGNYYRPGVSKLADVYMAGKDPHKITGANILGMTDEDYEAGLKLEKKFPKGREKPLHDARQLAKALNFGLPGGLGARKFVLFAKVQYGVLLATTDGRFNVVQNEHQNQDARIDLDKAIERANQLKKQWFKLYPEIRVYCDWVGNQCPDKMTYSAHQWVPPTWDEIKAGWVRTPHRLRGDCYYNSGCNTYFQALASDGGKHALYEVVRECLTGWTWDGQRSVLYGCRVLAFIHDEIFLEVPEDRAHECAMRVQELMELVMAAYVPDIYIIAEPALARRWYKGMEPVWVDAEGNQWDRDKAIAAGVPVILVCWEPQQKAAA